MSALKFPRWTDQEFSILDDVYPVGGSRAVHALLPHRSMGVIKLRAHRRGLRAPVRTGYVRNVTLAAVEAALALARAEMAAARPPRRTGANGLAAAALGCSESTIYARMREKRALERAEIMARIEARMHRRAAA